MVEFEEVITVHERRTYLSGTFKGKFRGYLDERKSDLRNVNFYDIEVYEAEIEVRHADIRQWMDGESEVFSEQHNFITKLPSPLPCTIKYPDGTNKRFKIELKGVKLLSYRLFNQQYEQDLMFGTITGQFSGYIVHHDTEKTLRPVELVTSDSLETYVEDLPKTRPELTNITTGDQETKGPYVRDRLIGVDGKTYFGDWRYVAGGRRGSWWPSLYSIFGWVLLALIIVPVLLAGWPLILPVLLILGISWLVKAFGGLIMSLLNGLFRVASFLLLLGFLFGIGELIRLSRVHELADAKKDSREKTIQKEDAVTQDTLISHYRVWQDYRGNEYAGALEILKTDFDRAASYRTTINFEPQNEDDYRRIVEAVTFSDSSALGRVYNMFDSIREKNNLDRIAFAEMITSCIQDIPYTMLLDNDCDARLYNDAYIRKYLREGNKCEGPVKFGFYSPAEFSGHLKGDCDTRSMMLYLTLSRFGYDVSMLVSDLYKHAVIAIHLPIKGVSKTIDGKRYVLWETTAAGFRPGVFPQHMADMRYWYPALISSKTHL